MQQMSSRLSHPEVTHLLQYPCLAYWWRQEDELVRDDGLSVLLSPMYCLFQSSQESCT